MVAVIILGILILSAGVCWIDYRRSLNTVHIWDSLSPAAKAQVVEAMRVRAQRAKEEADS